MEGEGEVDDREQVTRRTGENAHASLLSAPLLQRHEEELPRHLQGHAQTPADLDVDEGISEEVRHEANQADGSGTEVGQKVRQAVCSQRSREHANTA